MSGKRPLIVVTRPTLDEAYQRVRNGIARRHLVILVGECRVEYQGRARSTLERGERVVIVKEDGAILVHRSSGYEPVNWQPPDCHFKTSLREGTLLLEAIRRRPRESLKVYFSRILLATVLDLHDDGVFALHVSEKEMQQVILANPALIEDGFTTIAYEKHVNPGFIDIYGADAQGRMVVLELKRVKAGRDAAIQLAKYVEDVRREVNREVRGILVAPEIARGVQRLLATLDLEYKHISLEKLASLLSNRVKPISDYFTA